MTGAQTCSGPQGQVELVAISALWERGGATKGGRTGPASCYPSRGRDPAVAASTNKAGAEAWLAKGSHLCPFQSSGGQDVRGLKKGLLARAAQR